MPPVCLPPASSSGQAESPEQTLENLELTCLSQRPHLTALSAPGQPRAAGAHPAPGLLPCAQRGDLTHSPLGGHLPGMVLPPRDLPSPLRLQPLQTLGPSRGPRSKAQTSTRARQKPLLTRFPRTSNRCPSVQFSRSQGAQEGCLPTTEYGAARAQRSPGHPSTRKGRAPAKLGCGPTQAALDAPLSSHVEEGAQP